MGNATDPIGTSPSRFRPCGIDCGEVSSQGRRVSVADLEDIPAPRYLLRERDQIYGEEFRLRVKGMQIEEVITAARSPWQNPYAERLIGSIRRECLDHLIVINEDHLRRTLRSYFDYYHNFRPHQGLDGNSPAPREIDTPANGRIITSPQVGGLHHSYRRAA